MTLNPATRLFRAVPAHGQAVGAVGRPAAGLLLQREALCMLSPRMLSVHAMRRTLTLPLLWRLSIGALLVVYYDGVLLLDDRAGPARLGRHEWGGHAWFG